MKNIVYERFLTACCLDLAVISLPSPHHRWSLDNSTVADIDTVSGFITARTYGSTVVTVEDLRLSGHQQTSTIHVVRPISLVLSLSPLLGKETGAVSNVKQSVVLSDSNWQVVAGRKYVVQAFAFSKESGKKPLLLTKVRCFSNACTLEVGSSFFAE